MAVPKLRFKEFKGNWDSRKFSDILSFLGTNSFSRDKMNNISGSVKNVHYGDILVRYGNVLDVSGEQIPFINEDVSTCKIKEKDYLLSGDVIIADTAEDYTVGKATEIINTQGIKIVAGLHTQACRPKRKFAIGYIGNFINSSAFRHQLRRIVQGTKVLSVIKSYLTDMEIHFPVEKEQKKIADFLTTFDKRIAAQQNIIADLEETKKGLLQKIFSQEIRFKDDNGQDYPDWKKGKLSEIADFLQGLTYHPEDVVNTGKVVLRSSNIRNGQISYEDVICVNMEITDKLTLQENDVLMCVRNGSKKLVGKTAIITKGDLGNTWGAFMMILRAKENAGFLFQYLNSKCFFKEMFVDLGTATINQITKGMLQNCKMMIPSIMEQRKIADFLSTFDKKITAEKQILSDLKEMKKGLLQQMFV